MPVPSYRVPVKIARGTYANLSASLASLEEGEIVYANDQNALYVVEGGVLTVASADLGTSSIDSLSDVDTTTTPPSDGQALVWDNANAEWVPGGVSGEIEWTLTANGTTDYIFAGAGFAGTETDPVVYVVRGQTYKFTNGMGAHPFQIQSTQGAGGTAYNDGITNNAVSNGTLTWEVRMDAPSTLYYQCTSHADMNGTIHVLNEGSGVASIDDLADVNTTTAAPTDKQALVWNNSNSEWEPGDILASDPSPALSADLDVVTFYITSTTTDGDIEVAANGIGAFVVRGNTNSGKLVLNCESNTHGVSISSPPHSAGASYDLVLPSTAGTADQVLKTDGSGNLDWVDQTAGASSIGDLSDVDTTTVAPTDGQALVWDNTAGQWEPGTVASGSVASIDDVGDVDTTTATPTINQVLAWDGSNWVPMDQSGGGGGSTGSRLTETQTAASGAATFTGLGHNGTLLSVTSSLDAWIVLYGSATDRTSDAGRAYDTDPASGSGVLAEFYVTAGSTVLATPGTTYFNNDTSVAEALYAAVRDQAGVDVNSQITIVAYGQQAITTVTGGVFGSG